MEKKLDIREQRLKEIFMDEIRIRKTNLSIIYRFKKKSLICEKGGGILMIQR